MTDYYVLIIFMALCTSLIMMATVACNAMLPKQQRRLFLTLFGTTAVAALCEFLGVALNGTGPDARPVITLVKATEFSLAPSLAVLYAAVLGPEDKSVRIAMGVAFAHAIAEWILAPFGIVFSIDETGTYHHGVMYPLYIAAYIVSAAFLLVSAKRFSDSFQYRNRRVPWLVLAFVFACIIIQLVSSETRIVWLALAIGGSMLYIYYCSVVQQTDALTRLLNRHSFENTIAQLKSPATILLFDVDSFKQVNDTYGHAAGDACLRLVGKTIFETFSEYGSCYRVGGDEFCVILTNSKANAEEIERNFERALDGIRRKTDFVPTISIGEAHIDPATDDVANAYSKADELMYARKRQRKEEAAANQASAE